MIKDYVRRYHLGKLTLNSMNDSWNNASKIDTIRGFFRNTVNVLLRYI